MAKLRAAIITDIHYGPDRGNRLGSKAPRLLDKFMRAAAAFDPDVIVDIGDRVTASGAEEAESGMRAVTEAFNRAAAPKHYTVGNHDIRYLSRADNERLTGSPSSSYGADAGDFRLLFFNPRRRGEKLAVGAGDLRWLRAQLTATDRPVILFSHVPLDNLAVKPGDAFSFEQGPEIRRILEESGKVKLVMSGHIHRHRHREINGITYIAQQSLTRAYRRKYKVPSGAWSLLEADGDKISLAIDGKIKRRLVIG
jgi:predicted MPP superfamily phosphohydrolase